MENKYIKPFVGRTEQINAFWNSYNNISGECKIINFYGMTGMGKSRLINNIERNLADQKGKFIKVDIDYCMKKDLTIGKNTQAREEILMKMRNQLIDKYGFQFKKFDETLCNYYISLGLPKDSPEIQAILSKNPGLVEQVGELVKDTIKQYLFPATATVRIGKMILSPVFRKFQEKEEEKETIYSKMTGFFRKFQKEEEEEETKQLYSKITSDFETDLKDNMENRKEKLVIFIDTYEMLSNESKGIGSSENVDSWLINDIIKPSNNILWVIAGREPLNWENEKYKIQKYELSYLNETESETFLQSMGIENAELCEQIYKISNGMPMYLNLCVDQYNELKEEKETIDISLFGDNLTELADNIIRNMSIEEQEILSYLSCMDNWNDDFIRKYGSKFITCFSYIRYSNIKNKSIILQNENKTYSIIGTAKEILYKRCDENIKYIAMQNLAMYYEEQLENDNMELIELIDLLYKYMKTNILSEKDESTAIKNFNKMKPKLEYLRVLRKYDDISNILNNIIPKFSNKNVLIEMYKTLTCTLMESGNYPIAEEKILEYEKIFEDDTSSDDYIEMIELKSEILLYLYREDEAIQILEKEYALNSNNTLIIEQLALAYGRKDDEEYRDKAIAMINELLEGNKIDEKEKKFLKRSKANMYSNWGEYDKAIKIFDELIEQTDDEIEIAYLENDKATPLSKKERYDEALQSAEKAYEIRERKLGKTHSNTLNSLNVKANILSNSNRFDEAIEIYIYVYNQRKTDFGELNYYTIRSLINLAKTYYYKGDKNKAYETFNYSKKLLQESNVSKKKKMLKDVDSFMEDIKKEEGEKDG